MKEYPLDLLQEGMTFSQDVFMEGDAVFVPAGVPIRDRDIARLRKLGISTVASDGEPAAAAGSGAEKSAKSAPSAGSSMMDQVFNSPERQEVVKAYKVAVTHLRAFHEEVREHGASDGTVIERLTDLLIQLLEKRRNDVIQYILFGLHGESGFEENALNSCVVSVLMGWKLNMVRHRLLHLAAGAILHDVGMLRLPDEVREKRGKLTREELQAIRTHPTHSYRIITRELGMPEEVGLTALQHQERWDGGGYPRGLAGNDILFLSRIVSVADSFEAMVSERPYRGSMIGYQAVRAILSDNGRRFDPEVVKAFIATIGIYPLGSVVLLNDASIGRVVDVNGDAPLRPRVKLMVSRGGRPEPEDQSATIDLGTDRRLFIVRAVDPKNLGSAGA